jgi:predicted RNA-binding protein Jag
MGGIMGSSPELLGTVQKFSNGQEVKIPNTDTETTNNIISKYLEAVESYRKPPNMSQEVYDQRIKDYLIYELVMTREYDADGNQIPKEMTPEERAYGERAVDEALSDISPYSKMQGLANNYITGQQGNEDRALSDRLSRLAFVRGELPRDVPQSVVDSLSGRTFRDDDQAAAVAQEFVAMPEMVAQSNMAPSMGEISPILSQPNVQSNTLSSEALLNQQAPRPTVSSLEAPSMDGMPSEETGISSLPQGAPVRESSVINTFMRNLLSPVGEGIKSIVQPVGESIQTTLDPLKASIAAGRDGQRFDPLTTLFNQTIENQKQAVPGGINISEYRENLENYLSPESMRMAETIQVGNVPYKYDRNTGTAYRMDGAPIAAAEQATVDKSLTSDQSVEMLNAPIEASQQVQDKNLKKQEDLVFNMDPKKTTFAERVAERKRLMELNELPSVTADDVGAPEPLVTQEEVANLSEDKKTETNSVSLEPEVKVSEATKDTLRPTVRPPNLLDVKTGDPDSFIDAALGGKGGSAKDNVKSYEAQFREMLGIKDKDKAKEMWHNLSMIGFAIAAGQDPSALANIAQGMLEGTKMMKADRDADEKLNQDIALMAFAERNKDKRLDAQLASQERVAGMRKTQGVLDNRATAVQKMLKTMGGSLKYMNMPIEEQMVIANDLVNAMPEYGGAGETPTSAASASAGPAIGDTVNDATHGLIEYTKDGWKKVT